MWVLLNSGDATTRISLAKISWSIF